MRRRIVLLGPPASGKGTQAAMIREHYGIPTVSTGEVLREEKNAGTDLGEQADRFTREGRLFPDSIALQLVGKWLQKNGDAFVFDGFPRSVPQADGFAALLSEHQCSLEVALSLEAGEDSIQRRVLNRMVCGACRRTFSIGLHLESAESPCPSCSGKLEKRNDDTLETLAQRMKEYREKTEPLISYYEGRGVLEAVKADETPEVVFEQVSQILEAV